MDPFNRISATLDTLAQRGADYAALMKATGEIPEGALGKGLAEMLFAQRALAEALDAARPYVAANLETLPPGKAQVFTDGLNVLSGLVLGFRLNQILATGESMPYCKLLDDAQKTYLGEEIR